MHPFMELHTKKAFLLYFLFARTVCADFVNRTIDDQYGDLVTGSQVQYTPEQFWAQGNTCSRCAFHPSNTSAFNGSWHDGTRVPQNDVEPLAFTFKFNGTAIYIFNIAVRLTLTDVNITLDGTWVGRYTEFFNISEQYRYDVPIFALDSIPYGEHTLTVDAFGPNQTLVLFDYALYTTNTSISDPQNPNASILPYSVSATSFVSVPTSSASVSGDASNESHRKVNVGAIVGGVLGAIILLGVVVGLVLCCRDRRRHWEGHDHLHKVVPFQGTTTDNDEEMSISKPQPGPPSTRSTLPLPGDEKSPSTAEFASLASSSSKPLTITSESTSLREQVSSLRAELEVLRSREHSSGPSRSSRRPSSSVTTPLKNEIALLREEVTQLKARQERKQSRERPMPSPMNETLVREVASLRAELEELRSQHDLSQLGDMLPRYSPPPPTTTIISALPASQDIQS